MEVEAREAILANVPKPRTENVLALLRFLIEKGKTVDLAPVVQPDADPNAPDKPAKTGTSVILGIIGSLSDEDLLVVAKIMTGEAGKDLTVEDMELGWMTELLAIWMERVNIARIVKNASRVVAALK